MAITTPSANDTATRLRLAITRTARRLRQEAGSELSPSLVAALSTIDGHGPVTPSELAEIERVKRPTATRLVTRLEQQGLVLRRADPDDGRVCRVSATDAGADLLRRLRTRKNAYLARRLRELPDEDLAALDRAAEVLERMLEDGRR